MLTIFSTPKPFEGHSNVIQRNAIKSWTLLHPEVEVILFGDEEGTAEACRDLAIHHEPHVIRNEHGTKYLNYIFDRASQIARHKILCYANCDIVLMSDLRVAAEKVRIQVKEFLMVGRRWDTDITERIEFESGDWEKRVRKLAQQGRGAQIPAFVDYFYFHKGLYREIPPLVVGRNYWDHWLVWKALDTPVPVIDCSRTVMAVHQNHDYGYSPGGSTGTHGDELAMRNKSLGGNGEQLRSTRNATHITTRAGKVREFPYYEKWISLMELGTRQGLLEHSFWLRKRLGLRKQTLEKAKQLLGASGEKR